jgi:signal transduction histidine kinase
VTEELHPILKRQLRRLALDADGVPPDAKGWQALLQRVTRAYVDQDQERYLMERSQDLASKEMAQLHAVVRAERDLLDQRVRERTAALAAANEAAELAHRASQERLRAESEAKMQSSKLEAMGTLAAGIAHDFNNILAGISGYAEMAADEMTEHSSARAYAAQAMSGCARARELVARMLTFARAGPARPVALDILVPVREALALLRASLSASIELSFRSSLTGTQGTIVADATQVMQIIMNLCINASHAMERGSISVCLDAVELGLGEPRRPFRGLCMSVTDNGTGMTPAVLERIFDPFFTTKAPGEGSGLGLSVVYGIVTGMGGLIEVRSTTIGAQTGTEFQVYLPAGDA